MSSNSHELTLETVLEALHATGAALAIPKKELLALAKDLRDNAVTLALTSADPIPMAQSIDAAIAVAVCACSTGPKFLTINDLMKRYQKSRKWVERLPVQRHKIEGAVLYSRDDIDAYDLTTRAKRF